MTITVLPAFTSAISDNPTDTSAGKVTPTRWNTGSVLSLATARLVGRTTAAAGAAEEISVGSGLTMAALSLALDIATAAQIRAGTANKALTADNIISALAIVTLTFSATQALDFSTFEFADVVATANITLSNPTNVQVGKTKYLMLKGSSASLLTVSFGSNFKGTLPTDTFSNAAYLLIGMTAYSATHIVVTSTKGL